MRKVLYWLAGLLVLVGLGILGRPGRAQARAEGHRDELILDGSGRAKARAHQASIRADKHQRNAVVASEAGLKAMDKVGTDNESMADLLDSWRKPVDGV